MRKLLVILVAGAIALAVPAPASAEPIELGHIPECVELVPAGIAVDDTPVRLDVRVLLDGVPLDRAREALDTVRGSYTPLGIEVAPTFEPVTFTGDDAEGLTQQAKDRFGAVRPAGTDVVYTLTGKDISGSPPIGNRVAGLADCIGGVAFDDRAFAVGEFVADDATRLLDLVVTGDHATAKIAAHEIGHLMGAHHHYGNCAEGVLSELGTELSACTLMFNTSSLTSLNFSALNGLVVRGHAQLFATP